MPRSQRGYSLSEENTPFETPRERRGASPSTPALRDWGLKSCTRCAIRCLPSVAARRFGLLLLPAAALPACRQSSAISVYFGFYQTCRCLPRRHCFARRVCWHHRQTVITPHLRSDSRAAAGSRRKSNRLATTMAASEAMPPRRALPLPRRRTPSSCKPAMESLSLGGCKGGCSLSEEREQPPLSVQRLRRCRPPLARGKIYFFLRMRMNGVHWSSCPAGLSRMISQSCSSVRVTLSPLPRMSRVRSLASTIIARMPVFS